MRSSQSLFNKVHIISPKLPATGTHTDLDCINTDWKRTFGQLTLVQFLLDRFAVGNKKLVASSHTNVSKSLGSPYFTYRSP